MRTVTELTQDARVKAWHFLSEDKRLGCGDGRLVRVGHTFRCDPDRIALCKYGFHGSVKALDGLTYAAGPIACRVELGGRIIRGDDKIVASERTVLAMVDATNILHEFACWCAERALRTIENPDRRLAAAIEAKRKWLRREITDAELEAAWYAAWHAAWDAARGAAKAAVWAAASEAAWGAARAAWYGAWYGAGAAEREAQNRKLTRMLNQVICFCAMTVSSSNDDGNDRTVD